MGKTNSKSTNASSFDHIKSEKKTIGARKKNIPACLFDKSQEAQQASPLSYVETPRLVENAVIVWLDGSLEKLSDTSHKSLSQFRRANSLVEIFYDLDKCSEYIKSIKNEKIYLIASGSLGPQIVSQIEHLDQVVSIYIFCGNKANHEQWTKEHRKIKGVHTRIRELGEIVKLDIRQADKSLSSISILPPATITELNEENKNFIYFQVLKSILLETQYDTKNRKEFIDYSKQFYLKNEYQLGLINTLEENYQLHSPVWWYTRYCFLYSMLRKAFDRGDFEIIYKLAFFIRDLHRDIKKIFLQTHSHQFQPITAYRATCMSSQELDQIKKNDGGLLAFNDFVLTTIERTVALKFAHQLRSKPDSISVLYRLNLDPETSSIPYIALNNLSYLSNNDGEILFSMNTIFHIDKVDRIHDHLFEIYLSPASKKDAQVKNLVDFMIEITSGLTGWYKLSKIMMDIKEYEHVENIYEYVYNQTEEQFREERAFLQHELGYIYDLKNNLPLSIKFYKQAIQIYLTYLPPNHPTLLSTYTNFASVLVKTGELDQALEQYNNALRIETPDHPNAVIQYNNIAAVYQQEGRYSEAQQTYEKAIQTLLEKYPTAHPILADTYHNLAGMFYSLKDYTKALNYYKKTHIIEEKYFLPNHPASVSTYFNIATTYEGARDYKKALKYAERAVECARSSFGNDHAEVKETINYVKQLRQHT